MRWHRPTEAADESREAAHSFDINHCLLSLGYRSVGLARPTLKLEGKGHRSSCCCDSASILGYEFEVAVSPRLPKSSLPSRLRGCYSCFCCNHKYETRLRWSVCVGAATS